MRFKGEEDYEAYIDSRKREYIDMLIEEQVEEVSVMADMEPDELLEFLHFDQEEFEQYAKSCYEIDRERTMGYD